MEDRSVLIIDDEEQLSSLLRRLITLEGFQAWEANNLQKACSILEKEKIDVVLCDVRLPDGDGVDFTSVIKSKYPLTEVILLTAFGNISDGIQAMKNGAFDYLVKGNDNDKVIPLLNRAIEKVSLQKRVHQLEKQISNKYSFENIIGKSESIQQTISLARKVSPTDTTVLLLGETGTGKEVFAQAIHYGSSRSNKAFVALNCSAFSKELLESEIFGHKAGSFTGATKDKKGLIEEAHNGTLFLDEIGEMHIDLQSKLLRVLETNEFIKVGDTKSTKVTVRTIAATNRDLQKEVTEGKFREDLFYRLNGFTISLPPLRNRTQDIPLLADHYLRLFSIKVNKRIKSISKEATRQLMDHAWKGNIRELKNVIEQAVILADDDESEIRNFPLLQIASPANGDQFALSEIEKAHIKKILELTKGNKTKAAELLGIGLTTLYRKMEEYKITSKQ